MPTNDALFDHLDLEGLEFLSARSANVVPDDAPRTELFQEGRYAAYAHDLGFAWRWAIARDGQEIQEGPALSLDSARLSARQVLAFFVKLDSPSNAA
jgi:soluble methane monooxygenase-binding protein MmoD